MIGPGGASCANLELKPDGILEREGVGIRSTCTSSSVIAVRVNCGYLRVIILSSAWKLQCR